MRFVRHTHNGPPEWGVEEEGSIHRLSALPAGEPALSDLANDAYLGLVADACIPEPSIGNHFDISDIPHHDGRFFV